MAKKPIISEIVNFIKQPSSSNEIPALGFKEKLITVFKIASLMMFIGFGASFILSFVIFRAGYSQDQNNIVLDSLSMFPGWIAALFVIGVGPFTEELSFRLFLKADKLLFLFGSFSFLCFSFTTLIPLFTDSDRANTYTTFFLGFVSILFLILLFTVKADFLKIKVNAVFKFLVYFSAISFGLIHITNYQNLNNFWWLSPLLVVPQIIVGFILPYVRVKLGFIWSFLTHCLYNTILSIYTFGLLCGPGKVAELITTKTNPDDLILKFTNFEQIYVSIVSFVSFATYFVVVVVAISLISEYFIWVSKREKI